MKKYNYYIKTILLIFGLNALIYFLIKIIGTNYYNFAINFDYKIPFIKEFIIIYDVWYPAQILSLLYIFIKDKKQYVRTIFSIIIGLLIAYFCFILIPSQMIRPIITDPFNDIFMFFTYLTYNADTPVNCFPSVHCLICFLLIFSSIRNKDLNLNFRIFITILNTLIILSTLLIKQHVVIDVLGALITAIFAYYITVKSKYIQRIAKQELAKIKNDI